MMLLMAFAILAGWGLSTWKTLGRAVWKPLAAALATLVAVAAFGTRQPVALVGFFLVALVLYVTAHEFWRGIRARQKTQGENFFQATTRLIARDRRRYGGYLVHMSMMLMAIGILGLELFQTETQGTLAKGESMRIAGYTVTYADIAQFDTAGNRNVTRAVVEVSRDGKILTELNPRIDYYYESQQPMTIPGVRSTLEDDLYVLLVDWEPVSAQGATFKVYHNPLVNWLWIGCLALVIGQLVAAWPDKDTEQARATRRRPVHASTD
jgi:cytochrome c-type biogenesis protein CcmF